MKDCYGRKLPELKMLAPFPRYSRSKCDFRRDFGRLRTSIANVSGTEQDIDNRKTALKTTISPASVDIIWSTKGEK